MRQKIAVESPKNYHLPLLVLSYTALIILLFSVVAYWLRFSFWMELFVTYLPQFTIVVTAIFLAIASIILYRAVKNGWSTTLSLSLKQKIFALISLVLFLHNIFIPALGTTASAKPVDYTGPSIKTLTLNKRYENRNLNQIINYVGLQKPDILAIQETYKNDADKLAESLGFGHWHVADCECDSVYGTDLAIFSKFPIENISMAVEDRIGGALRAEIVLGHQNRLTVYVVHVVPAYSTKAYSIRPNILNELADLINSESGPVLVMGDFSTTPFSIDMRQFISDIKNKALSTHNQPWPNCSWFKYSDFFCARIDYIFVPTEALFIEQTIGPDVGSDHRPIGVSFSLDY